LPSIHGRNKVASMLHYSQTAKRRRKKKETRICRVPCTTALTNKFSLKSMYPIKH
jgi:hypothetical protein